ncbi:MAG: NHLP bacteriocin system secretion protein [Hyphomicrobiaceae bacterium]|nr:NHLP bacteriocin system secretion protein [Hyphomicrobiaceae bacterium]
MSANPGSVAFRGEALDARGRVESLPSAMRVTTTWTRAVVLGLAAVMLIVVIASALVVVPVQVSGGGVLIDRSGVLLSSVISPSSGYVEGFSVKAGDRVEKGQAIARLSLPEQAASIRKLRSIVSGFETDGAAMDALAEQERREEGSLRKRRNANIERQISDLERRLVWLKEQQSAADGLLRDGLTTQARAVDARVAVQNAIFQLDQLRTEQVQVEQRALEADIRRERERRARILRIDQARLELAAAEANLAAENTLRAPVSGRVTDLLMETGAPLTAGQPVAIVAADEQDRADELEAILFVPQSAGKQIVPGAAVLLAPSSLKTREHDRLRGRVSSISGTIATKSTILKALGSEQLYDLVSRQGPVFEVVVSLERDRTAPSRFAWTSGHGPDASLTRGTPVSGKVAVEHVPLLGLALPALRGVLVRDRSVWTDDRT